jgi:hypothetical protein
MARTPLLQPQFGFKVRSDFLFLVFWLRSVRIFRSLPSDNWSRKRAGSEYVRRFPQFKPKALIRNEVARPHHFIPLQTPEAFRNAGSRGCFWFARLLRWFRQAVHCHLVRNASISAGSAFVGI